MFARTDGADRPDRRCHVDAGFNAYGINQVSERPQDVVYRLRFPDRRVRPGPCCLAAFLRRLEEDAATADKDVIEIEQLICEVKA